MTRVTAIRGQQVRSGGFLEIGRIYKGAPKTDNRPGADLTYFRVEFNDSPLFSADDAQAAWQQLYGDTPAVLNNVQFLTDDPESVLSSANEMWGKGAKGAPICTLRCDGSNVYERLDSSGMIRTPSPCQYPACKGMGSNGKPISCQFNARLIFFLPDFCARLGVIGQFMLVTHSRNDYENLVSTVDFVAANAGRLRNVAFTLYRQPQDIKTPDGMMVNKAIVHLDVMNAGAQAMALAAGQTAGLLMAGDTAGNTAGSEPVEVLLNPSIMVHIDSSGVVWYGFQAVDKRGVWTPDGDLVQAVIPNLYSLTPDEKHPAPKMKAKIYQDASTGRWLINALEAL